VASLHFLVTDGWFIRLKWYICSVFELSIFDCLPNMMSILRTADVHFISLNDMLFCICRLQFLSTKYLKNRIALLVKNDCKRTKKIIKSNHRQSFCSKILNANEYLWIHTTRRQHNMRCIRAQVANHIFPIICESFEFEQFIKIALDCRVS
jgi:hypothetical protein